MSYKSNREFRDESLYYEYLDWIEETPGMVYNNCLSFGFWILIRKGYPLDFVYKISEWKETEGGGLHIKFNDENESSIIPNWFREYSREIKD